MHAQIHEFDVNKNIHADMEYEDSMDYQIERNNIIEVGRELLEKELVARTWGNISAREDDDNFLITPSGLDYVTMRDSDIVSVNMTSGEWIGDHRPSGERGIHKAAYQVFKDVNFVVHTHQICGTALGLAGFENLEITDEEKEKLGGIALAAYGLPSSDTLINAVKTALNTGAHTILMIHHGVMVCGKDREEAMERTELLEEICKRNLENTSLADIKDRDIKPDEKTLDDLKKAIKAMEIADIEAGRIGGQVIETVSTKELITLAEYEKSVVSQLDDISQMVGVKVKAVKQDKVLAALRKTNAVLVKGIGAVVMAADKGDVEALSLLMQKMAIVKLHTLYYKKKATIGFFDSMGMHSNYVNNYSKQKK